MKKDTGILFREDPKKEPRKDISKDLFFEVYVTRLYTSKVVSSFPHQVAFPFFSLSLSSPHFQFKRTHTPLLPPHHLTGLPRREAVLKDLLLDPFLTKVARRAKGNTPLLTDSVCQSAHILRHHGLHIIPSPASCPE